MTGFNPQTCTTFSARLLAWFAAHARDLPWRHERTPYRVWVAEVMLQQTQAETVAPYFVRFVLRFPDIQTLAQAPLEDVLKVWEGLGYYARARHLHAAAREIVARYGGQLPDTFEALLALPGVGRYTAGAIASLAFGHDVPAVDGNVRRVLARVFAIHEPLAPREWEELAAKLLPPGQAGRF
ncbi:MAG: A/G-specific adenine glycosylase, partial [Anaerolineae bacterium]|nr:A/G-specific adenine glycosylase [Anaerolineae bacterium]